MYTYKTSSLPKSTTEVLVTVPWNDVSASYDSSFESLRKDLSVEGFRKGKVPAKIAEKHLSRDTVYKQLIQDLISKIYREIVEKEQYSPIISPKIDIQSAKENEDWKFTITIAQRPTVTLGEYKKAVQSAKADLKKDDIWVPGKDAAKSDDPAKDEERRQKSLNLALEALLKTASCDIPDLVVEAEIENRLSRLVDDVQKVGLTIDGYLKSKNITMEELRKRYTDEIVSTYQLEFILAALADEQNIVVEEAEMEALFANIKDEKERAEARKNAYFYASILRKQKTIDYLLNL